jgi:hypothetical protein
MLHCARATKADGVLTHSSNLRRAGVLILRHDPNTAVITIRPHLECVAVKRELGPSIAGPPKERTPVCKRDTRKIRDAIAQTPKRNAVSYEAACSM